MKITYDIDGKKFSYEQLDSQELEKINFNLTNPKGDFLNMGINNNSCKFFGLNINKNETLEIFKFVDEIIPTGLEVKEVIYEGFKVRRKFGSRYAQSMNVPVVLDDVDAKDTIGATGNLTYDDGGTLIEKVDVENEVVIEDSFYLGPTGGMIYEIINYEGEIFIDLDMRKRDDFNQWDRIYKVEKKDGIIFVEYIKNHGKDDEYRMFLGIKAMNFSYDLLEDWIKKDYSYSKKRNSLHEWFVFRLMKVNVLDRKRIIFGTGFNEQEVMNQINLLEKHYFELEGINKDMFKDTALLPEFKNPITQDISVAYMLSNNALFNFLNKELSNDDIRQGLYAGIPWFSDIWARDELVSLRAFINNGDEDLVKERLYYYLNSIDEDTGEVRIIPNRKSNTSADATFWLAKRFEDFLFHLIENERLNEVFNEGELRLIYNKLNNAFHKIVTNSWDFDEELLKVKFADSWMDTIEVEYPLDIQVQFLEFISFLGVLSELVGKTEDTQKYLDLEVLLKEKVRSSYYKEGKLFNEPYKDNLTSNVFLAYYLYPELFLRDDWELIFDNALEHLKSSWGGIASLSHKDPEFQEYYTGENNLSYHRGDVWFWVNNIAAICLNDLNEKKYRKFIGDILRSSTKDILTQGTIGYGSEISSFSSFRSEGCMAQLWSSSTYLEMVDKLFLRK